MRIQANNIKNIMNHNQATMKPHNKSPNTTAQQLKVFKKQVNKHQRRPHLKDLNLKNPRKKKKKQKKHETNKGAMSLEGGFDLFGTPATELLQSAGKPITETQLWKQQRVCFFFFFK